MADEKSYTHEPDVTLFINQATWFGKERKMTVCRFLDWFTGYLAVQDRRFILEALPFFQREHQQAEEILCALLETDFRKRQKIRLTSTRITRNTDWPRTYIKAFPLVPQKFHQIKTRLVPDHILLGLLADLARSWAGIARNLVEMFTLDEQNPFESQALAGRAKKLEHAVQAVQRRGIQPRARPLSTQYRQAIIRMLEPADQKLFLNSLNYWNSYDLAKVAKDMAALIRQQVVRDNITGLVSLFEVTTNLCILRAVIKNEWKLHSVGSKTDKNKNIYPFHLKKNDKNLIFGKGRPEILFPKHSHTQPDRMLALRELAGFSGSGYEPDIVMGFYRDGQEMQPLVIFGDAKRYEKADLAKAYKETVASTMIAYGHWAGLEIKQDADCENGFKCPVKPFFTLFHINNNQKNQICKRPRDQRTEDDNLPPVMAIALEHLQGDGEELRCWFCEIDNQVDKQLAVEQQASCESNESRPTYQPTLHYL
jgi:hypothetical protein